MKDASLNLYYCKYNIRARRYIELKIKKIFLQRCSKSLRNRDYFDKNRKI